MKLRSIILSIVLILPSLVWGQVGSLSDLMEKYSSRDGAEFKQVKGVALWVLKKNVPDNALDDVEKLDVLMIDSKEHPATLSSLKVDMETLLATTGAELLKSESEDGKHVSIYESDGDMVIFMDMGDNAMLMSAEGDFAAALEAVRGGK